jgi:hypothetical protein
VLVPDTEMGLVSTTSAVIFAIFFAIDEAPAPDVIAVSSDCQAPRPTQPTVP